MSAVPAANAPEPRRPAGTMSIGAVLSELKDGFPDVTVSKIRFLESEGLISPSRTASGYRRFTRADVDRLRHILTLQRDKFLPLKVIREQLDEMDAGNVAAAADGLATVTPMVSADQFRRAHVVQLTRAELAEQSGVGEALVTELVRADLLVPDAMDRFGADDVVIAQAAGRLRDYGVDVRHLRSVRTAARREADLVGLAAAPVARSKGDGAGQRAGEISREMTALLVTLHAMLVKGQVNREFGL